MRVIGMDVHRTFAQVAILEDGKVVCEQRLDLVQDIRRMSAIAQTVVWSAVPPLKSRSPNGRSCVSHPQPLTGRKGRRDRPMGRRGPHGREQRVLRESSPGLD